MSPQPSESILPLPASMAKRLMSQHETPTAITILLADDPLGSCPPTSRAASVPRALTDISSIAEWGPSTIESWKPSRTAKTLKSQYLPVLDEFLLSRALVATEWNSNRCIRYSIHSVGGILNESNMVPV